MKRRHELILAILKWLETHAEPWIDRREVDPHLNSDGELLKEKVIAYHVDLCEQAGYIRLQTVKHPYPMTQIQLTWAGHNKLDQSAERPLSPQGC